MKRPSKAELKKKYKIQNDDFEILTQLPSEDERKKRGGAFIKVGEAFGLEEWMWKNVWGFVFAMIVVPPIVQSDWDYWKPTAVNAYNQINICLQAFDQKQKNVERVALSSPDSLMRWDINIPDSYPLQLSCGTSATTIFGSDSGKITV